MAVSRTEIVNKALTLVGANPIVNLTDDTQNARVVNRVYEIALKSILSECLWRFATRRKLLAQSAEVLGEKSDSENYHQHADHFLRVMNLDKAKNKG